MASSVQSLFNRMQKDVDCEGFAVAISLCIKGEWLDSLLLEIIIALSFTGVNTT